MKSVVIENPTYRGGTEVMVCRTIAADPQAEFAMELMSKISIATAEIDGEDSAGRQKLRIMTPQEVATRACEISQCAFDEFKKRDWLIDLPVPKQAKLKDEL